MIENRNSLKEDEVFWEKEQLCLPSTFLWALPHETLISKSKESESELKEGNKQIYLCRCNLSIYPWSLSYESLISKKEKSVGELEFKGNTQMTCSLDTCFWVLTHASLICESNSEKSKEKNNKM